MGAAGMNPGGISPVERWRFTTWPDIKTAAVMPTSLCSTVFLLVVFSLLPVVAESAALSTEYRPIGFEHVDHSDGLSQNSVQAILQDSRGFMWFGTESGLNRFDGYEIRQYRPDRRTPGALPGGHVSRSRRRELSGVPVERQPRRISAAAGCGRRQRPT